MTGNVPAPSLRAVMPGSSPAKLASTASAAPHSHLESAASPTTSAADQEAGPAEQPGSSAPPTTPAQSPAPAAAAAADAQEAGPARDPEKSPLPPAQASLPLPLPAAAAGSGQPYASSAAAPESAVVAASSSLPAPALQSDVNKATAEYLQEYKQNVKAQWGELYVSYHTGTATLLGVLLHALKLSRPWWSEDAAGNNASAQPSSSVAPSTLGMTTTSSSSSSSSSTTTTSSSSSSAERTRYILKKQAQVLIQGSPTLTAVWPDLMDMIRQGHLQQPYNNNSAYPYDSHLYFLRGTPIEDERRCKGRGDDGEVYSLELGDGSKWAVKAYWPDILLDDADQEVRALQLATHAGCCYVISIKGMALVASARWPLRLGLVMPNGMYTLEHHTDGERLKGEKELRAVLFQVLLAVHELHHNGIWHRSLTPRKFMLMAADPDAPFADEEYQLAVIDLADSRMVGELQPGQPMLVREPQPGHEYAHARAPEYVAACTPYDHDTAGGATAAKTPMPGPPSSWLKADIWSVGAIALYVWFGKKQEWLGDQRYHTSGEVASRVLELSAAAGQADRREIEEVDMGYLQFVADDDAERIAGVVAWAVASGNAAAAAWEVPAGFLLLLGGCLVADPAQRKTARELLALPWFEGERAQMLERAREQGTAAPPPSPPPAAVAGATDSPPAPSTRHSWGPALDALLEEWRQL